MTLKRFSAKKTERMKDKKLPHQRKAVKRTGIDQFGPKTIARSHPDHFLDYFHLFEQKGS